MLYILAGFGVIFLLLIALVVGALFLVRTDDKVYLTHFDSHR